MVNITLSVPTELKKSLDKHAEINWSEVARGAIRQKLSELSLFKSIVGKSKLTEKEAEKLSVKLGKRVNRSIHEKFKKSHPSAF